MYPTKALSPYPKAPCIKWPEPKRKVFKSKSFNPDKKSPKVAMDDDLVSDICIIIINQINQCLLTPHLLLLCFK